MCCVNDLFEIYADGYTEQLHYTEQLLHYTEQLLHYTEQLHNNNTPSQLNQLGNYSTHFLSGRSYILRPPFSCGGQFTDTGN